MGSFLDKPATDKETLNGTGNGMKWGMSAMQGWRVDMEDAHIAKTEIDKWPESAIFGVFDGHGGKVTSKFAASRLLTRISDEAGFKPSATVPELQVALRSAFLNLDAELRSLPTFASGEDHSGSTAVTVLVTPTHHVCANAGDSRSVLCRGGAAVPLSEDHKPYNTVERQRIQEAGGTVSMNRVNGDLAVSRAFGDFGYKNNRSKAPEAQMVSPEPEFITHERSGEDEFIIVACDGIWDVMSNDDCVKYVREKLECYDTLGGVCENLLDHCLDLGSKDNMSVIIVTFPSAPKPDPAKVKAQAEKDAVSKAKREAEHQ